MNNQNYHKIRTIIADIELTNKLIEDLKALNKGTLENILGVSSILRKKRNLAKELLIEMIRAKFSFTQFKSLYEKIFTYLEKEGDVNLVPEDWQKNINEAAEFLV